MRDGSQLVHKVADVLLTIWGEQTNLTLCGTKFCTRKFQLPYKNSFLLLFPSPHTYFLRFLTIFAFVMQPNDAKGWFTIGRKACVTYVALRTSYSEPLCVGNCVNYVAYVVCAGIDKSSILAYVHKKS